MELRQTNFRQTEAQLPPPVDPRENIRACLARNLPEFSPALFPHDGTAVVCGSGPSLPSMIEEIKLERGKRRPIIAVKGAHDLLVKNGIQPDVYFHCEAKPKLDNVQLHNEHTLYLLAGRSGPELFDMLVSAGRKVLVFHTWAEREGVIEELVGRPLIGGGTTSGLRAITAMWLWGFAKFVLYGFDSCLSEDGRKRFTDTQGLPNEVYKVDRVVDGQRFWCNGAMAMQADEFQEYYKILPDVTFEVKGGGLIAAIVEARRKRGFRA